MSWRGQQPGRIGRSSIWKCTAEFPGLLARPTRRSAVANLRDAFAKYCFKCGLEHHRGEKRPFFRLLPGPRASVAGAAARLFLRCVSWKFTFRLFKLRALAWSGQLLVTTRVVFFSLILFCGAENAVCVRIKVGLGFRGPPACSARQRNAKFSQNSLPLPVPGVAVLLGIFSKTRRRLFCVECKITVGPRRQGDASRSQLICTPSLSVYLLPALTEPRGVAPTCLRSQVRTRADRKCVYF